jgi:hypothetical protein
MSDITKQIDQIAAFISKQDIEEWILPKILEFYEPKIRHLAKYAYGREAFENGATLPLKAFTAAAEKELKDALETYIFKYEHWRSGRDINSYLLKCLSSLVRRIKTELDSVKKINILICPGCRTENKKEFLTQFGDMWRCLECAAQIDVLGKMIRETTDKNLILSMESKLKLHKTFEIHSKKGYKCPECDRFIPESCNGINGITCPYLDCSYFGDIFKLEKMAHPVGQGCQFNVSLQTPLTSEYKNTGELLDLIKAEGIEDPNVNIEVGQNFKTELNIVKEVVKQQLDAVKRTNSVGTMLQKVLMYEAYDNMIKKYPEEMVSYLVHLKQSADFPLQARIFQEYVGLMQDALPYKIEKNGKVYDVVSLLDDKIDLFEGISVFDAVVKPDGSIPNNTKECYMGGRKFKNYGPCFIGLVIDIKDEAGNSLKSKIKDYSFVQINMEGVKPGTNVNVKHYRIPSHYEMKSLVHLQRSRKKLVNRVYFKLNGKQRITKSLDFDLKNCKMIGDLDVHGDNKMEAR